MFRSGSFDFDVQPSASRFREEGHGVLARLLGVRAKVDPVGFKQPVTVLQPGTLCWTALQDTTDEGWIFF